MLSGLIALCFMISPVCSDLPVAQPSQPAASIGPPPLSFPDKPNQQSRWCQRPDGWPRELVAPRRAGFWDLIGTFVLKCGDSTQTVKLYLDDPNAKLTKITGVKSEIHPKYQAIQALYQDQHGEWRIKKVHSWRRSRFSHVLEANSGQVTLSIQNEGVVVFSMLGKPIPEWELKAAANANGPSTLTIQIVNGELAVKEPPQ
jgi:hypothetical protein